MEYEEWEDDAYENRILGQPEGTETIEGLKEYLIMMENRQEIEIEPEEDFKFESGWVNATIGAQHVAEILGVDLAELVRRHLRGDWGDIRYEEDRQANEEALERGLRILSSYDLEDGERLWIITEWDRSMSTILRPEEY